MSTCRRALLSFRRASSGRKKRLDTSSDEAPEAPDIHSIHMSGHWVYLITAVSVLLLQHALYHSSISRITAVPTSLRQHRLWRLQVSSFLLQAAPLLLKYNPRECSTGLNAPLLALLLYYLSVSSSSGCVIWSRLLHPSLTG